MGQTKKALNLILSDLKDVSLAISFAKSQDDPDLWEDLLNYSMDKPRFIHGLLVEAGTSIDPIKLVRRIPSGLEIEGLREGLTRMIREHDLQASISQGAAKVLQSEVAVGMATLRKGQQRGIKFNIIEEKAVSDTGDRNEASSNTDTEKALSPSRPPTFQPGRCAGCHLPFYPNGKLPCLDYTKMSSVLIHYVRVKKRKSSLASHVDMSSTYRTFTRMIPQQPRTETSPECRPHARCQKLAYPP